MSYLSGVRIRKSSEEKAMESRALGRVYEDGEILVRQGEAGDCMFVIQEGEVEILAEEDDREVQLAVRGPGEMIGEMAIFEREVRSATVRARGRVRALTVNKKTFLRRVQEDPSLAFRIVQTMSSRMRDLNQEVARLKRGGG
jgi:CRP-like cAMP-binding protein